MPYSCFQAVAGGAERGSPRVSGLESQSTAVSRKGLSPLEGNSAHPHNPPMFAESALLRPPDRADPPKQESGCHQTFRMLATSRQVTLKPLASSAAPAGLAVGPDPPQHHPPLQPSKLCQAFYGAMTLMVYSSPSPGCPFKKPPGNLWPVVLLAALRRGGESAVKSRSKRPYLRRGASEKSLVGVCPRNKQLQVVQALNTDFRRRQLRLTPSWPFSAHG